MEGLTPNMMEFLMDCHEREQQKMEPCISRTRSAEELFERGLIKPLSYVGRDGKVCTAWFTTSSGRKYLTEQLMEQ